MSFHAKTKVWRSTPKVAVASSVTIKVDQSSKITHNLPHNGSSRRRREYASWAIVCLSAIKQDKLIWYQRRGTCFPHSPAFALQTTTYLCAREGEALSATIWRHVLPSSDETKACSRTNCCRGLGWITDLRRGSGESRSSAGC